MFYFFIKIENIITKSTFKLQKALHRLFCLSDSFKCPILGSLVPLFWISGDVSSGFQSQSGFYFIRIVQANVV